MNERIRELMIDAGYAAPELAGRANRLVELLVQEFASENRRLSYELMGVIVDVEEGPGFDAVCLNTVHRVHDELANSANLKKHFGVE